MIPADATDRRGERSIITVAVAREGDVVLARARARRLAGLLGLGPQDATRLATAVSEIARNALGHGGGGRAEFALREVPAPGPSLLIARVSDAGPGVPDLDAVLGGRFRSATGLGLGLRGARRLADGFAVATGPRGTTVTIAKALPPRASPPPPGALPSIAAALPSIAAALAAEADDDPVAEVRAQNAELLASLAALRDQQEEAERLNEELARTNAGVLALHAELEERARAVERLNADLEARVERAVAEAGRAQEASRQAQKMEAVGQLTGGVAHDFNNLLTVIRSSSDLLRRPGLPEERRRRYLDAIAETVERAARLTGQLLAFARRQPLAPEVFDAGARVRGVAEMLATLLGARVRLVTDLPAEPLLIEADASQFETALVNMAVNARDAMGGEGRLTVALREADGVPAIRGQGGARGAFAALSVSDTGAGIAPGDLERVFEPFFTTKGVGKGTGLGLSQVFGFAKQSGGDVAVVSEPGQGTTFALYLPRARDGAVLAPPREPRRGGASGHGGVIGHGRGRRVLVVEDNPEVGRVSTQVLADLGYGTAWAASGEEALAALEGDGAAFDVVFTDVVMPGMGGVALAREVRRRRPDLPVVLTSGYSEVLAAEGPGEFALLRKPYAADELVRALREALSEPPHPGEAS